MRRIIDFWAMCSVLVVFGGGLIACIRRLDHGRRSDLREKESLLAELHEQLEKSPSVARAVEFFKQSGTESRLQHLLSPEINALSAVERTLKEDLDDLFRLLNRIAHAVTISRILTREETEVFSWYFRLLQHHPVLSQYFYESGFLDLWDFAQSWMEKDEFEV
jgi:hypothetical protein